MMMVVSQKSSGVVAAKRKIKINPKKTLIGSKDGSAARKQLKRRRSNTKTSV